MNRLDHIQVAFSRLLTAIIFGDCNWMLSSYCHLKNHWLKWYINKIFFLEADHCANSYIYERVFDDANT